MSGWDDLSEAQKAEIARWSRRHHSSVGRQDRLMREDVATRSFTLCVDWLATHGFAEAAAALEAELFEPVGGAAR